MELHKLSEECSHGIVIEKSRFYGFILRVIDKLQLEDFALTRRALQKMGIYTIQNPTSTPEFAYSKPRFVRCYFQRTEIVELNWGKWSRELIEVLGSTDISDLKLIYPSNAIHIRRGDLMSLNHDHGVLSDEFFVNNSFSVLPTYICTDEMSLSDDITESIRPKGVLTQLDSSTWQTLKVFCNSANFLGSNSTLSWWACYLRAKNGQGLSALPNPWTRIEFGYEQALRISNVDYVRAEFLNAK